MFRKPGALRPLRPHQTRALEELRLALKDGKRRPMLMAPTGAGKTLLASHIFQRALDKGKRVAFVVPALSLIDQTVAAFEGEGLHSVAVMQGIHPRTDAAQPIQVCSAQTLARRQKPAVDLVIVDEAHILHKSTLEWLAELKCPVIGLSATPWSKGLGLYYDHLIVAATTAELIEQGYLSKFVVFAPSVPDLSGIHSIGGDYHQGELSERVNTAQLVGDVIETWIKRGENRPTLCYGVDRKHAEHLQQRFVEAGIAAEYMDAFTKREDRERVFDRFRCGETRIICNVGVLTTGVDLPMASCLIDAKPTRSKMLYVQTIGRGLRTAPGKDKLIVLDHAGNALRLGLVTDILNDRLDDGEKRQGASEKPERAEPLPILCDECKAVIPREAKTCPQCGALREAKSKVRHTDGELVEFGSGMKSTWTATASEKATFFAELRWIAIERGYAEGWAARNFKEKFGVWPNDPRIRSAEPEPPCLKTKQWVRSRMIAYAKGRRGVG
jgi:DNA repair protein RadD